MRRYLTLAAAIFLLLLAACGDDGAASETPAGTTASAAATLPASPTSTAVATATPQPTATATASPTPRPAGLLVEAQALTDDGLLRIAEAVSTVDGWVVVHADQDGAPGAVLGATPLPAGGGSDLTVTIDPLLATERLFVMLHVEGNGDDSFDPAQDGPLLVDGDPLIAVLEIDLQISVPVLEVAAQTVDAETGRVVIPAVTALAPGWVALYADADGAPGRLLAFTDVPAGRTSNVTLTVNPYEATPTLFAALHTDGGEIGRFEPDVDPYVVVGAAPLLVSFAVALPVDILMLDQPIVDNRLVVSRVVVNEPAWVAVYYNDAEGTSWIVGFGLLEPGINENVVIDLIAEPPVTDLYLRLHVDVDDPGIFEFPVADGPLLVDGRLPPTVPFITNPGNYLIARDQAPLDGSVTIPLVVSDVPVWVVVYGDDDGVRGPVLGRVRQPAGLLIDVIVPLDDAPPGTVYVAIHRDNGDDLFAPDAGDPILRRNGADIATPFALLAP